MLRADPRSKIGQPPSRLLANAPWLEVCSVCALRSKLMAQLRDPGPTVDEQTPEEEDKNVQRRLYVACNGGEMTTGRNMWIELIFERIRTSRRRSQLLRLSCATMFRAL